MADVIAAVDLGSNSFHMVVARYSHGQLVIIDRLREVVRLAAGVGDDGRIDKNVAARALACLERFGQRLRDMHARNVRVVGTNSLRISRRKQAFLERARDALGFPIEIVSGMEEARLIYSGVAHNLPNELGRRLVVDIGGGGGGGGEPTQAAFQRRGWERAVGSSGTVRVIADSIREIDPAASNVTPEGLELLLKRLAESGSLRELDLDAVSEERRPVFPGGT